jgi:hypothetical protein
MVHVSSIMWRIKNQPSNSTSCSDNALRLAVLVMGKLYWGLRVMMSSFSIWGCVLKGCFERGIFWRAKSHLKGIEDFNLEGADAYKLSIYLSIYLSLSTLRHRKKQSVGGSANLLCKWHSDVASAAPAQLSWIQMPRSCSWERKFNPLMRRFIAAAPTCKKFSHTWDPKLINLARKSSKFEGRPNCWLQVETVKKANCRKGCST